MRGEALVRLAIDRHNRSDGLIATPRYFFANRLFKAVPFSNSGPIRL
jgi:hypothetical protein